MKKYLLSVLLAIAILFSCKKDSTSDVQQDNCLLDSISLYETTPNGIPGLVTVAKFNYQKNELKEIKIYFNNYLTETQKLFFDVNKRLNYQECTFGNDTYPLLKKEFLFNASGLFSGIITYRQKPNSNTEFFKSQELSLSYDGNNLTNAKVSYWNPNDTLIPVQTDTISYLSRNGNVISGQETQTYKIMLTENLLIKNSQFLLDPFFEKYSFYNLRLHFLPFILNKNTTTTLLGHGGSNIFNFRVAYDQFDQPESISNDFAVWDYHYKNCE